MGNAEAAVNVGHVGLENEGAQGNDNSESDSSDGDSEEQNEQDVEVNSEDTAGSGSSDEGGDGDDLLYPGSTITLGDAMLAILAFFMRRKLTGQCLNVLLSLIALLLPRNNQCVKSLYKFKKVFLHERAVLSCIPHAK